MRLEDRSCTPQRMTKIQLRQSKEKKDHFEDILSLIREQKHDNRKAVKRPIY